MPDTSQIEVIAPNFKRRLSGVTSTVYRLVPLQARSIGVVTCGPGLPSHLPQISFWQCLTLPRRGSDGARVWHARRNSEMLAGILLKTLLRKKLKLLFTSASQRQHTGYTKWLIRQMDGVIATSARSAAYLEVPHTVIHHGIDTDHFAPALEKSALRRALDLPDTGPLIGCFGRIRKQKGSDVFVDAMLGVLQKHPSATAILMGGVTDQHQNFLSELKDKVTAAGLSDRLLFLPEVSVIKVRDYFQALDIYVAPQRWEGFGLTPLEAMACGVPAVATRVGAFEELVKDGETGFLVDIADVAAISDRVDHLLSDTAQLHAFADAARADAEQNFQLQGEADAIIAVYRRLLDQS